MNAKEIIARVENKSSREAERSLLELKPEALPKETERQITSTVTKATILEDEYLKANIDRIRELYSHINANMSQTEIFFRATECLLDKIDPMRRAPSARKSKLEIEREVFRKYQCCSFKDPVTGRTCGSKHLLQIDHIVPRALGGKDEITNLRLLCAEHNRLEAIRELGKKTMAPYITAP